MSKFWTETTPINVTNLNKMIDMMYPVGSYYETSDDTFNPNTFWGGTWELETDGTALVSKSSTTESKFNVETGTIVGAETHTLTVNEMPSHYHSAKQGSFLTYGYSTANSNLESGGNNTIGAHGGNATAATGGSQAHNNIQPSKVVNRWHRTA